MSVFSSIQNEKNNNMNKLVTKAFSVVKFVYLKIHYTQVAWIDFDVVFLSLKRTYYVFYCTTTNYCKANRKAQFNKNMKTIN